MPEASAVLTREPSTIPALNPVALLEDFAQFLTEADTTKNLKLWKDDESGEKVLDRKALADWYRANKKSEGKKSTGWFGKILSIGRNVEPPKHNGMKDPISLYASRKNEAVNGVAITKEQLTDAIATELFDGQVLIAALDDLVNDEQPSGPFLSGRDKDHLRHMAKGQK